MKNNKTGLQEEIQLVIFRLRNEEFGVNIMHVREIVRLVEITHIPEAPGFLQGVINLRGHVIAVIDLSRQFGLPPLAEAPKTSRIIIVEIGNTSVGMIVDEVPQVLRLAQENIEEPPDFLQTKINMDYISGIGKLEDRLIVLLDLSKVLAVDQLEIASAVGEDK